MDTVLEPCSVHPPQPHIRGTGIPGEWRLFPGIKVAESIYQFATIQVLLGGSYIESRKIRSAIPVFHNRSRSYERLPLARPSARWSFAHVDTATSGSDAGPTEQG
jgi:hypothetical protein